MKTFSIKAQIDSELKDFFQKKIKIGSAIVDGKEVGGYEYSQWETLQNIEFIDGSKFLNGDRDSEGQQKFYLNVASFRRDVASKNIDIDVKNFLFVPEEDQSEYGAVLMRKMFRRWAKDQGLSEEINHTVDLFPKYGTVVLKKVGNEVEEVDLLKIRNSQGAESLKDADYVIEEHQMTLSEMEEYEDWDTSNIEAEWDDKIQVYERYGKVPADWYRKYHPEYNGDKPVYALVVTVIDHIKVGDDAILFCEEAECPYIEVHYEKLPGRWLGRGEIEKQFENQAARNMVFNLRKKGLAWSSKNIFQYGGDIAINNLVREVRDGDMLKVEANNRIERVDVGSQASADYTAIDNIIEQNADQRSFTFEVATGESMPSGTPFRLGAIVGQSVNAYYNLKREKLGIFWKDVIYEFMLPEFTKENNDEVDESLTDTEEGFDTLRQAKRDALIGDMVVNAVLKGVPVNYEEIASAVDILLQGKTTDYYKLPPKYLKTLKYRFDIDVTGESIDVPKKIESLTTLYQIQAQRGDPRADETLRKIMMLTGEKLSRQTTSMSTPVAGQPGGMAQGQAGQEQIPNQVGSQV